MAIKKELIQFTIVNSTDCSINLPLFQQNVYSINATTKYSWDITSAVLSCGTGSIVVNGVTLNLSYAANLTGLLNALNGLGYGFFCTETIGGDTFVYVVDDTNIYGDLDLCPSGSTTTTTSTSTAAPETTTTTTSTTTEEPTTTTTTSTTTAEPETTTTTTSTTTVEPETTTTTTSTTTEEPTTTTTTSTTTAEPETTTTTTSTTTAEPETTTTTTSTTTEEPITTTTTTSTTTDVGLPCDDYINNTGNTLTGIDYVDCDGTQFTNTSVEPNQSICVRQGTLGGGESGFLTLLGSCGTYTTTSTTTSD